MNLRIWQKILILMLIPISFEVAATAFLVHVLNETQKTTDRFYNSRKILSEYHEMQKNFNNTAIDMATMGSYREDGRPPDFDADKKRIEMAKVGVLSAADIHPTVREALAMAPAVFDHALDVIETARKLYYDKSIPHEKKGSMLKNQVFSLIMESDPLVQRIVDVETTIESLESSESEKARWMVTASAIAAFAISLLISFSVAIFFYRSFGKRLQLIEGNAEKVALGQRLPRALSGGDEIDELDRTLHNAAQYVESVHKKEFAVLNKSVDVLCSIDTRFKIVSIGESVENSWHYSVGDVLGRSIFTLLPEQDATRVRNLLSETSQMAAEHDFETELKCGDGKIREFAWKVSWIPEESKYYCVIRDISERKNVERAKQRLLAIASHDLRTPLMSVSANLSSLSAGRYGELDSNLRTALDQSEQNLDKLMELIQSLLDLERMESTKTQLELGCVSALDATLEAIKSVDQQARSAQVTIISPNRDESILADERRLVQILVTLLQNAIGQSLPGQKVAVAITSKESLVQISVNDQGPGIAVEEIDLVFDKYFQSRNKVQQKNKSNGLSLALAKVLTEAQNGSIGVSSERGKGSQFYVQLQRFKLNAKEDKP
jgi:PAS domain S-box-containing protein